MILFIEILIAGCSVIRHGINIEDSSASGLTEKLFESVEKMNITGKGFFIQKADIVITTPEGTQRVIGTVKYEKPQKYLISIKNRTGIEVARIFISEDTILINDRLNRKLYYGSSDYLMRKYGIKPNVLPVIFGDFISDRFTDNKEINNFDGILNVSCLSNGVKIKYSIDSKKGKAIQAIPESSLADEHIEVNYKKFSKKGAVIIPGIIIINDFKRGTIIEIRIKKIEVPWDKNIDFIPGNLYEHIELL